MSSGKRHGCQEAPPQACLWDLGADLGVTAGGLSFDLITTYKKVSSELVSSMPDTIPWYETLVVAVTDDHTSWLTGTGFFFFLALEFIISHLWGSELEYQSQGIVRAVG